MTPDDEGGSFRQLVLGVTDGVLRQLVGDAAWSVEEVAWLDTAPPPPPSLATMDAPVSSLHEPVPALLALRGVGAVLRVVVRAPEGLLELHLPASAEPAVFLVALADQLQDHVVESSELWGQPVPRCPVHDVHPLMPAQVGSGAAWTCPRGDVVVEIAGALPG